jgi:hypothetical protein
MLEEDAHSCERYHLQMDEEEMIFAMVIGYMAMHALWDPPAAARPHRGDIVVFRYVKGHAMLGQVEKVTTCSNVHKVTTQHTCCIENGRKKDYI